MSIEAFRIGRTEYSSSFFDGQGAKKYGGRWNSKGIPLVYTADSLALATLEIVVNFDAEQVRRSYSYAPVSIEEGLIQDISAFAELPVNWREAPTPLHVQEIGDKWVKSRTSVVLRVPTAVLPIGQNYLLNIEHPDFSMLDLGYPRPLSIDERLLG